MNLKEIKKVLTSSPSEILKAWSESDSEEGTTARHLLHLINFIGANLGIIILLLSIYIWYVVTVPGCNQLFTVRDAFGNIFTPEDYYKMNPKCLLMCNTTLEINGS